MSVPELVGGLPPPCRMAIPRVFFMVRHNADNQRTTISLDFLNNKKDCKNLQNNIEDSIKKIEFGILSVLWQIIDVKLCFSDSIDNLFIDKDSRNLFIKFLFDKYSIRLNESDLLVRYKSKNINNVGDLVSYIKSLKIE